MATESEIEELQLELEAKVCGLDVDALGQLAEHLTLEKGKLGRLQLSKRVREKIEVDVSEAEDKETLLVGLLAFVQGKPPPLEDDTTTETKVKVEPPTPTEKAQGEETKEKYDKMVSDCSTLNKKLEQLQDQNQKDTETRIQEAIKKYESLPAELESIKAVLEMKNEEIKQLRKEKMEKHLELEQLEDIKVQTQKLQQENESLTFVVETKSRFERQLSVERDSLRNSLERESAKSKRLSLENEELQWRLVNSTSPPGTPTGEARPLSATSNRNSFRLSASFPDIGTPIDE